MSMAYESWTLRYVPDPVRGEFVNIGLIVGFDGGDWAIRHIGSFVRASRLGGNAALLRPVLGGLSQRIATANGRHDGSYRGFDELNDTHPISRSELADMRARFNNALQISDPMPAYGESAASVAEMLYSHLVMESVRETASRPRTRMLKDFRSAISRAWTGDLEVPLMRNPVVRLGRERQGFDFALHDNEVEQMTQVISLNRKDLDQVSMEIKAWNFSVSLLRDGGGEVDREPGRASLHVAPDTPITMLHDEPRSASERELLSVARDSWRRLGVSDFTTEQVDAAATRALSLVS